MEYSYFDWAASAPCDRQASEILLKTLSCYPGNPSALHTKGHEAKLLIEKCRNDCAACLHIPTKTVVFTSGGSESNNIVVSSFLRKRHPIQILSTPIEHPSILNPLFELKNAGHTVNLLKMTDTGIFSVDDLKQKLTPSVALVCLIHTHNETGTIQPIAEAVRIIREFEKTNRIRIHVHCDAVQSAGKATPDWSELDIDSASLSAHKFGGPRGVGILYSKAPIQPIYCGGGQERGLRPGTENLPGIAAMTTALQQREHNRDAETTIALQIRAMLISAFRKNQHIFLPFIDTEEARNSTHFSPYLLMIAIPGLPSEVTQRLLNDRGFAVSAGSACSSNASANKQKIKNPFGFDHKIAESLLRLSWGHSTTFDETKALIQAVEAIIKENSILLRQKL